MNYIDTELLHDLETAVVALDYQICNYQGTEDDEFFLYLCDEHCKYITELEELIKEYSQ